MEDTSYPVEDKAFVISAGGEEYEASLTWNGRRYELNSPDLRSLRAVVVGQVCVDLRGTAASFFDRPDDK
jgi:hypothetical protein